MNDQELVFINKALEGHSLDISNLVNIHFQLVASYSALADRVKAVETQVNELRLNQQNNNDW